MKPVRYAGYFHKESGEEYGFVGYAELEDEGGGRSDVCLMAPRISGFSHAKHTEAKPEHTVYLIVHPEDFATLFSEGSPARERSTEVVNNDKQ